MAIHTNRWQLLFLFCLGIFFASAFCMKWMEPDFVYKGEAFTIVGLELSYSKDKVSAILAEIGPTVKKSLQYHLAFDFAFMVGVYLGIVALCMIAMAKIRNESLKKWLVLLAVLQIIAWGLDIRENIYLFDWIDNPSIGEKEFLSYHLIVIGKWCFALTGAIVAVPLAILKGRTKNKTHFLF